MKVFIGENLSCSVNYQYDYIFNELANNHEITQNVSEADKIVFIGTCCCTEPKIKYMLEYILSILCQKQDSAKVYLTGCMTREFKKKELFFINDFLENYIDYLIPQNEPNLLLKLISKEDFSDLEQSEFGYIDTFSDKAVIYLANGCLNNCSFCKKTFQNYPLKSVELSQLKDAIDLLDQNQFSEICLKATNICQCGIDIYNEPILPEVIEYIETKKNIKTLGLVGFSFSDAIKYNFQDTIKNSTKVNGICGSLESGSDRTLKLIRKGFTSQEIIDFVSTIRQKYPKTLYLNIISGFPTETIEDVVKTLRVLKELSPYWVEINRYENSSFVDSNVYTQLTANEIQEHTRIYSKVLKRRGINYSISGEGYKFNK